MVKEGPSPLPLWLVLCAMCVVCVQAFLRKSAVSRLLIKLTGSDQNLESLAPVLLARYDIDGNKVLDKVRCSTQSPSHTAEPKKGGVLPCRLYCLGMHSCLCGKCGRE